MPTVKNYKYKELYESSNMDLFKFHDEPTSLHKHAEATEVVPKLVIEKYKDNPKELKKREAILAKDTNVAWKYVDEISRKPFPAGEEAISKSASRATMYAVLYLKRRFPKGEAVISTTASSALIYARDVLHKPFPEGEASIANRRDFTIDYLEHFPERKEVMNNLLVQNGKREIR